MDALYGLLETASTRRRFSRTEKETAVTLFDDMHALLETYKNPPGFRLASGEVAKGATGRIALSAYFLLLGRLALGPDYARHDRRFDHWKTRLGHHIMLGNFSRQWEKGLYCCPTCTLSVLPLYCVGAFEEFDCDLLRNNVLEAYTNKTWRFASHYSRKYAGWALRFA